MSGFRDQNAVQATAQDLAQNPSPVAKNALPQNPLAQNLSPDSAQSPAQDFAVEDCDCPPAPIPEGALVREMLIVNRKGLHARATAKFVQCAEIFDAAVQVTRCGETVGGTSIMGILTLGAGIGTTITVTATGEQAQQALDALGALVANRFGEDE